MILPKAPAKIRDIATINVLEAFFLTTETNQYPIPITAKILNQLKLNFAAFSETKGMKSLIFVPQAIPSFSTNAI